MVPSIVFYPLSHSVSYFNLPSGSKLQIDKLANIIISEYKEYQHIPFLSDIKIFVPDILGIKKPMRWEKLMALMITALTGQIPTRSEVLVGRQILQHLPKAFKKNRVDYEFVFGFLPYILVGFKVHLSFSFKSDSNRMIDVVRFIVDLFQAKHVKIESFLCAHRGTDVPVRHSLITRIPDEKILRNLNLQTGILLNAKRRDGKIVWFQQFPTTMASANMFPEMFVRYLETGEVPELMRLLDSHTKQIQRHMQNYPIEIFLFNLDIHTLSVMMHLESRYGDAWKVKEFYKIHRDDALIDIAINFALPVVKRFMPFLHTPSYREKLISMKPNLIELNLKNADSIVTSDQIESAIRWFYNNYIYLPPEAKALWETTFYYLWGKRARENAGTVGVGIERDHLAHQFLAYAYGYLGTENLHYLKAIPLLYARRNPKEMAGRHLKYFSFRQFWR